MASAGAGRWALVLTSAVFLTACEEGGQPSLESREAATDETADPQGSAETTLIERDVEAPEVFQVTDAGLWDGRPSLGGIWVAHSDVKDPERVMIRNQANGKFVIGALFRRERENPGPRFQVSSDAAEALGMLAGAPAELSVTALRREEVPIAAPAAPAAPAESTATDEIAATPLDPVAAVAASAIEKAEATDPPPSRPKPQMPASAIVVADPADTPATAASEPAVAPVASSLARPYVQIGIFNIEGNASEAAEMLRKDGIVPEIKKSTSNGKDYWRVLAGPAASTTDRKALLTKVEALGFTDAYAVKN